MTISAPIARRLLASAGGALVLGLASGCQEADKPAPPPNITISPVAPSGPPPKGTNMGPGSDAATDTTIHKPST